ncbi:hypothetical protein [Mycoplasma sp. Ms02]|uniref:hypothetical protein n=1 Tax=Mycoplasma sp. Ms02 TaxID=353851 RepID=UPI001C89A0F5|nr:hypothetical protein [Mycoplasma sp. Ms02]QZE12232.1 hypothetical protein K4L35_02715 [Mycoplasma sp. Ms02]
MVGNNSHGFTNEINIVENINNKSLNILNANLKRFIKEICKDNNIEISESEIIKAELSKYEIDSQTGKRINVKPDFYIKIRNICFGISTKLGSGNSIHQESVESFISWLQGSDKAVIHDQSVFDDLRFFIWADGSLDGSSQIQKNSEGKVIGRFTTKEFKHLYPERHAKIEKLLQDNQELIIKRALFQGKSKREVDYVYHGTSERGHWISQEKLLKYNLENPLFKSTFNIGRMTFQIYNSDLMATKVGSRKRGQVQLKYGSLLSDIQDLLFFVENNMDSLQGKTQEEKLCQTLNKNKKSKYWKTLSDNISLDESKNYYAVHVNSKVYSKNVNKKVSPKSDLILICTSKEIHKTFLLKNQYIITESALQKENIQYQKVPESGISVKMKKSKSYTITKMSIESFKNAFAEYVDDIDIKTKSLVLYSTKEKVDLNPEIAKNLELKEQNYKEFCSRYLNIGLKNFLDFENIKKINAIIKDELKNVIDNNIEIKQAIFLGKGWIEDPYYSSFVYIEGKLTKASFNPYRIDNGSGRSRGIYTIIFKPS